MKNLILFSLATLGGLAASFAQTEPIQTGAAPDPKKAEIQEVKPSAPPVPKTAEVQEVKAGAPLPQSAGGVECRQVVDQLRQNVQKAPTHVLTLLEDAVIANGGHCVGDLVQTAIVASKADAATVKKIVFVAITNAPKQAPLIAEAAVAASPNSADSVRAAFAEAFDEKNPRLKGTDPVAKPAWEQANTSVAPPVMKPRTGPVAAPGRSSTPAPATASSTADNAGGPGTAPAPIAPNPPRVAANSAQRNPFTDIDGAAAGGGDWQLMHDGVVGADGSGTKPQAAGSDASGAGSIVPPPSLEEEKKKLSFGSLGFLVPKLPTLPPVDAPVDLYFASPFGGIPAP